VVYKVMYYVSFTHIWGRGGAVFAYGSLLVFCKGMEAGIGIKTRVTEGRLYGHQKHAI